MTEFLSQEKIDAIVQRTKTGGGELVKLLKTGSAYYAPRKAVEEMIKGTLRDQKRVLPVITHFSGQYGFDGIFAGHQSFLAEAELRRCWKSTSMTRRKLHPRLLCKLSRMVLSLLNNS